MKDFHFKNFIFFFRFLLCQPIDSMTSVIDLYPEGCKLRNIRSSLENILWIYLAIVQFSFGSTGKDEKKKSTQIKTRQETSSSEPKKSKQID